jgi:hypothetical protein
MMMIMMIQARSEEPRKKIYDDDYDQSLSKTTQGRIVLQQQLETLKKLLLKDGQISILRSNLGTS